MNLLITAYSATLLILLSSCMKYTQPEIHLIPEGFTGEVIITFNDPEGSPVEIEDDKLLFRIGPDGKLNSQGAPNLGIRPLDTGTFYYVNEDGARTELHLINKENRTDEEIVISDLFVVHKRFHYFVDSPKNIEKYPNPGIDEMRKEY